MATNNRAVFRNAEFERWANHEAERAALAPEEQFLIEAFFNPHKKTLEAGTGGGRIMLALQKMGYHHLTGFDFIPESIDLARQRDMHGSIQFDVQDAVNLTYPDSTFEQAIYPEQILCFIENDNDRRQAFAEAHRVLQKGSPAIFTSLSMDARQNSTFYRVYLTYLQVLRRLKGSKRPIESLPWLKMGDRINFGALLDRPPYTHWYRTADFIDLLKSVGFEVVGFGTAAQLKYQQLCDSVPALAQQPLAGHLYVVARKK